MLNSIDNNNNKQRRNSFPIDTPLNSSNKQKVNQRNSYQGSPDLKLGPSSTFARIFGMSRKSIKKKELNKLFPKHIPEKYYDSQEISIKSNNINEKDLEKDIDKLDNVKELSLTRYIYQKGNGLSSLPKNISNLAYLNKLVLASNKFSSLPEAICQITTLEELDLRDCGIRGDVQKLSNLVSLKRLILDNNEIIAPDLTSLSNLNYLSVISNGLQVSPKYSGNSLQVLNLSNNFMSNLPDDCFTSCRVLKKFYISENELTQLPHSIGNLESLEILDVSKNRLKILSQNIGLLHSLKRLNISVNELENLPESTRNLSKSLDFIWFGNDIINPPIEVVNQGLEAIANYFQKKKLGNFVKNTRVKLMVLGDKDAGKTSLAGSLQGIKCSSSHNSSTIGIDFHLWKADDSIEVLIVDCAGEKKYALTHQLFISNGIIFAVVVNLKDYQCEDSYFYYKIGYWMNAILSRSPNAVIMIVPTHLDLVHLNNKSGKVVQEKCRHIMESAKKHYTKRLEKIKNIRNTKPGKMQPILPTHIKYSSGEQVEILKEEKQFNLIPISNSGHEGVDNLKIEIKSIIENYCPTVHREVDKSWLELEEYCEELASRKESCPVITFDELHKDFDKISTEDELKEALNYLDSLGPILFFKSVKKVFLDPKWLINLLKKVFVDSKEQLPGYNDKMRELKIFKSDYDKDINCLFQNAELSFQLIKCLWQDMVNNEELFSELIKLFIDFELFYENAEENNKEKKLLVPWYFSKEKVVMEDISQEVIIVRIDTGGTLPDGFFQSLIIRVRRLFKVMKPWQQGFIGSTKTRGRIRCYCKNEMHGSLIEIIASASGDDLLHQWEPILNILKTFQELIPYWPGIEYRTQSLCYSCVAKKSDSVFFWNLDLSDPQQLPGDSDCDFEAKPIDSSRLYPPFGLLYNTMGKQDEELNKKIEGILRKDLLVEISNLQSLWVRRNELRQLLGVTGNSDSEKEDEIIYNILLAWVNSIGPNPATRNDLIKKLKNMYPYPDSAIQLLYFS